MKLKLLPLLLLTTLPALADEPISGDWNIACPKGPDGKPYTGTVTFTPIGGVYQVAWNIPQGNATGVGLPDGKNIAIAWGTGNYGLSVYAIGANGSLTGKWTQANQGDKTAVENATGGHPGVLDGQYKLLSADFSGVRSEGTLKITKAGDFFKLDYKLGNETYGGVGLRVGNSLYAAWGTSDNFGLLAYGFNGDKGAGKWVGNKSTAVVTEALSK